MAFENIRHTWPGLEASGDLSGDQFRIMALDSNGQAARAGAGVLALGVLQNNPAALGEAAAVSAPSSTTKVEVGAAVALGAEVTSDSVGRGVTSASGDYILGQARTAASNAGEIITVYQNQPGRTP